MTNECQWCWYTRIFCSVLDTPKCLCVQGWIFPLTFWLDSKKRGAIPPSKQMIQVKTHKDFDGINSWKVFVLVWIEPIIKCLLGEHTFVGHFCGILLKKRPGNDQNSLHANFQICVGKPVWINSNLYPLPTWTPPPFNKESLHSLCSHFPLMGRGGGGQVDGHIVIIIIIIIFTVNNKCHKEREEKTNITK